MGAHSLTRWNESLVPSCARAKPAKTALLTPRLPSMRRGAETQQEPTPSARVLEVADRQDPVGAAIVGPTFRIGSR